MQANRVALPLLLTLLLCGLTACGGGGKSNSTTPSSPPSTTPTPPPVTPPVTPPAKVYGAEFTVSPSGDDNNPGTASAPFKSLEKARDAVRTVIAKGMPSGGVAVWLKGGIYERSATLELGAADSGSSESARVNWLASPGETVRIRGGRTLSASRFESVTSASPVWGRLDPSARGKVLQIDLKAQGISDFGVLKKRGFGKTLSSALELFVDGAPMWLARYPDVDVHIAEQSTTGNEFALYGSTSPDVAGTYLKYKEENGVSSFKRTSGTKEFMLHRTVFSNPTTGEAGWRWYLNTSAYPADATWWSDTRLADETPQRFFGNSYTSGRPTGIDPQAPFHGYLHTAEPISSPSFSYVGDRPSRWSSAPDAWIDGFWSSEWEEEHFPFTIDASAHKITLQGSPANFVLGVHQPWFAYNLLEEITQPGEWYLDRTSGILYLWPPAGFSTSSDVVVSMLETPLVSLKDASFVRFQNLTLEAGRQKLIESLRGKNITCDNLVLRNSGGGSLEVRESTNTRISGCNIVNSGHTAIWLTGGDRKTLTPSNNILENCDVSHYGRFQASGVMGVSIEGCGAIVRHNHIHDAPDRAINYGGNDHLIEFNELDHLCQFCADAAAIYTGGWSTRGCKIRNNFIHHVRSAINGSQTHGIYVDECGEGAWSEGNVFYEVAGTAHKYGGRDNVAINNIIARCGSALWTDIWGLNKAQPDSSYAGYIKDLNDLGYRQEPWASRYPECAKIPSTWAEVIQDPQTWLTPSNCTFARNVVWMENPGWIFRYDYAKKYFNNGAALETANMRNTDPLFTDEAQLNLLLKPNSPAFLLPGFVDIPFEQIGIQK